MKTNDLRFTAEKTNVLIDGEKCDIIARIRLNDECKNGHQDFSITGDIYKAGRRGDRNMISCGCIHDDILKHFPEYSLFVGLHLCDFNGVPMHGVANGFYHLRNGVNKTPTTDKNFKKEFCNYYRMTAKQFDVINESENKIEYQILLNDLGILDNWKKQAEQGIKTLEKLTGDEFLNDSKRSNIGEPLKAEEIANFKKQKESGYYSLENKRKRAKAERVKKKSDKIQAIKDDCLKTVSKAEEEKNVKLWLISHIEKLNNKSLNRKKGFNLDFTFDNYIYYQHKKELSFNWLDYKTQMSKIEFKMICDNLNESDFNKLPANVSFNFGDKEVFTRN